MIPKECKRLAEVDFPIAVVSKACGAGEVHKAWASVYATSLVGAAAARGLPGDATWSSAA